MAKIMSLNLWGYEDWNNRKDNIVSLLNYERPDVIALQEVRLLHDSPMQISQSNFITKVCGLPYYVFAPTYRRTNLKSDVSHGLAFYSKYPINSVEIYHLKQGEGFKEKCSALIISLEINGKAVDICNVHFGNTDKESDLHIKEFIGFLKHRGLRPIIMGDFNIINIDNYLGTSLLAGYVSSSQCLNYVSMPKINNRLDYIIAPEAKYKMSEVRCSEAYVSDHRALFAEINIYE